MFRTKLFRDCLFAFYISLKVGIVLIMSSCIREDLDECEVARQQVKVAFDYSQTGISHSGTTIIFYPAAEMTGGEKVSVSTHRSEEQINLLPGEYSVLVINETFSDFSTIKFRNTERFGEVEAYLIPSVDTGQLYRNATPANAEMLVVDTLSSFVVKEGAADTTLKVFMLRRAMAPVNVVLHTKNMKYIRKASFSISGFSEGQILASRQNTSASIEHAVENSKLSYYDQSKTNGAVTGSFNTFGLNSRKEQPYRLIFDALLIDGITTVHKEFDIRDCIKMNEEEYGISIEIELGTKENPVIEIPKVENEDGKSPFDPDVDDWEEEEDIDIPLN